MTGTTLTRLAGEAARAFDSALALSGLALIAVGVALISVPASLIVSGVLLFAIAIGRMRA